MPVTRTQNDLAFSVMEHLGLLAPGESVSNRDRESIIRRYGNLLEELRDEQTVYWEENAIPKETFEGVVNVIALLVAPSFGLVTLTGVEMDNALELAKRRIRKRVVKPASGETVADWDNYF